MKNIKVGQVAEYSCDKVIVTRVGHKDMDLAYESLRVPGQPDHRAPPAGFLNRPQDELVDIGNGRVIWNHE